MSHITALKMNRLFEKSKTGVFKRKEPIPTIPNKTVPCLGCGDPLVMKFGQIVFWHRECRTKTRLRMHRDLKGKR